MFYERHEDETMRVAAEFLCIHGDSTSAADTDQMRDQLVACEPVQHSSLRRWFVKKVYIDREATTSVSRWSVRYYVDYTCNAGEYFVFVS